MTGFIADFRYAVRRMRRSPGFTVVAAIVLGLGIGVNIALFGIVNALLLRPLPVKAPEELVYIYWTNTAGQMMPVLFEEQFDFFRDQVAEVADVTSHGAIGASLTVDDENERVSGESVRSEYFGLLGVKAVLGRTLSSQDDDPANPEAAVVISHDLWQRRFKSDPGVVGKAVKLERRHFTVVGVMEPGFTGLSDFWTPSQFWASRHHLFPGLKLGERPFARLKPDVTFEQFQALVATKTPALAKSRLDRMPPASRDQFGDRIRAQRFPVLRATDVPMPFHPQWEVIPKRILIALTAVVGLVLVIASANTAGLLLARGVTRTAEIAVRFCKPLGHDFTPSVFFNMIEMR
jgi:hypothetical protein